MYNKRVLTICHGEKNKQIANCKKKKQKQIS